MNGHAHRPSADDYGIPLRSAIDPSGRVVVDSYAQDISSGFDTGPPLYNPMNPERTQSSPQVDIKDPIQIHLLTETALSDSKEYEILSQEEIDSLKKQCQLLDQRIDSTRSNLLIQAKYRDAAVSMAKLYPSSHPGEDFSNEIREAEAEREMCERKCEQLAAELFHLEKRIMEPKRRLLEHTAGVLQLTHKASKRKGTAPNGQPLNGVPGSPESMYTYTQSRNSLDGPDDFYTDDTSFGGFDQMDSRGPRKNPIEIPLKSPIREQHSQQLKEMDRLREENRLLMQSVVDVEQKLEGLNGTLRDTIIRFNPDGNDEFESPPSASQTRDLPRGEMLKNQVEYLASGLVAVQAEQELLMGEGSRGGSDSDTEKALLELWDLIQSGYTNIKQQKDERRRARAEKGLEDDESGDDGIDLSDTYTLLNFSSRVRCLYRQATILKDQKSVLKRQIKQQRELNNKSDAEKDAELASKQEELEQNHIILQRAERDAMDAQKMLSEALEDLEEARSVAVSADSEKTKALEAKLQDMQRALDESESSSQDTRARLAQVDTSINALSAQLDEAIESRDAVQHQSEQLQKQLAEQHKALESREKEYEDFNLSYAELQKELSGKHEQLKSREKEYEELNLSYAELKTEITIARAELDGAYGTRAERAADVAAVQSKSEIEKLRDELAATAKELEQLTKETIASEREKVEIETKLDEALAARSELEADLSTLRQRFDDESNKTRDHVSRLQEQLDGERLRAGRGSGEGSRPGAGASMLSEQFRATMREERKKFQEEIKEERTRNRRLEEELARLKRAQGPGKSPLSPR